MSKSRKIQILPWVVFFGGIVIMSFLAFELRSDLSMLEQSLEINKSPQEVFQTIISTENIGKISQNIGNIQVNQQGVFSQGFSYSRVLYSHGIPNPQIVNILELEPNKRLTTQTTLVGFTITYEYVLDSTPQGNTLLSIKKDGQGGWSILKPLMIHLLTRPEHDGDHILRIKTVAETTH